MSNFSHISDSSTGKEKLALQNWPICCSIPLLRTKEDQSNICQTFFRDDKNKQKENFDNELERHKSYFRKDKEALVAMLMQYKEALNEMEADEVSWLGCFLNSVNYSHY